MSVVNVWCGATTPSSVTVVGKVDGSSMRLAVADNPGLTGATYFGPVEPTAEGIARVTATGLSASTRYHYALEVDSVLDSTFPGQFRTHPPTGRPATFTVGMATCAGATSDAPGVGDVMASARLSNHPVFDTIRQQAIADEWLLFIQGGDLHYYDIGSGIHVRNNDLTTYRRAYDDVLLQPRRHALYRNVAMAYMYDDHDFGPNDADSTAPGRDTAVRVYQERVPHYPRGAASAKSANYQSFQIARVLFVILDVRAERDPNAAPPGPSKTMLGKAQKNWLHTLLRTSTARFLVLVMPNQWDNPIFVDSWTSFEHERDEIVEMLASPGGDTTKNWLGKMCILQGDAHSLGIASANPWGGFPVYQFSPLDSTPTDEQAWKDVGSVSGRAHYGTLRIADSGSAITVTGTGWSDGRQLMEYTFTVLDDPAAPATVQATHSALYEASNHTYGTAFISGTYADCGVVFTAPATGGVIVYTSGAPRNIHSAGAAVAYLSPEVRTGGTVGRGSVVLAAHDTRSVRSNLTGSTTVRAGVTHALLTGLTPGNVYNAQILHRVTSRTGEFFHRGIIVAPAT